MQVGPITVKMALGGERSFDQEQGDDRDFSLSETAMLFYWLSCS